MVASSGAAETLLSATGIGPDGGWLIEAPGAVRVFSVLGTNGDLFDGTAAYLLLFNIAFVVGPVVPVPPTLALGANSPMMAGRDVLGDRGLLFPLGCLWAWSQSATSLVPFGGDPADRHFLAAFQYTAGS